MGHRLERPHPSAAELPEKPLLAFSAIINSALLLLWFALFTGAHDGLYRLHGRWFKRSREVFDTAHYGSMAVYKVLILMFDWVPLAALYLVAGGGGLAQDLRRGP